MFIGDEVKNSVLALADRNGGIVQPEQLVEAAADPSHPANGCFEWDDAKAAARDRLTTARIIIRSIRLVVDVVELTGPRRVPAFAVNQSGSGYATLDSLRSDPDAARAAAVYEFQRAAAALRRARQIGVELGLGPAVDATVARLVGDVESATQVYAAR